MMKFKYIIFNILLFFGSCYGMAQTTNIPDDNFENYLETHTADGSIVAIGDANSMGDGIANNGLVLTDRINTVVLLDVSGLGISDLTGIEDFSALETLFCSDNDLTALNISSNVNLSSLVCGSNALTTLDVSNITSLETFNCSENQIQDLDVSSNTVLKSLVVSGNEISTIDVSNNTELTTLNVSNNRIEGTIMLDNNLNLESLYCASNQITSLDVLPNTLLKNLNASGNAIMSLDLTAMNSVVCPDPQTDPVTLCQGTSSINVSNNILNNLVVSNGFNELISIFDASNNPELFCIQIDPGFTPSGWLKDDWAYYSENMCVDIYTYVPDDNFEQALIDLGFDNVLDNLVLTTSIETIANLNVSNYAISSLIGIEDFTALEVLDCSNNFLTDIDLTNNVLLQEVDAENNNLEALNISANVALVTVNCAGNSIPNLDVSANNDLVNLNCSSNALNELNVNSNLLLSNLDCSNNQIESFDVSANSNLTMLLCNDNNLFALNINNGNNAALTSMNATNNANLSCIKVDDVAFANGAAGWQKDATATYSLDCGTYVPDDNFEQALIDQGIDSDGTLNNFVPTADVVGVTILDVSGLVISDLTGIEGFTSLQNLNVSNNMLNTLNLSNNLDLEVLDCSINQIENLDLSNNTALNSVLCNYNALQTLNIENGNNAALTVFNSTDNPNLFCINVDDAIVGSIPANWQKDDFAAYNGDCLNNRFTLIPDTFFEQALIDLGYDDIIDGQVLTSSIEHIQTLNVSDEGISDLTGIRDFKSLIELDCSSNFLEELDVSDMIYLERLNCSSNYLLTNDLAQTVGLFNTTGTVSLRELFCSDNNLNSLDVSQNLNLELLNCSNNNLDVLNVMGNTALKELNCSNNNLAALDVSSSIVLEELNCNSNDINTLTTIATNNNTLLSLSCANNELSNIDITNYLELNRLDCGSNELTQLDVTSNINLSLLSAGNNQISDLDLQNNVNLVEVYMSQNDLSQLDTSSNVLLEQLNLDFNQISGLDLSNNSELLFLSVSNNTLLTLNLLNNTNLIEVNCSANEMSSVELSNNLGALKRLNLSNNQIEGDLDLTTMAISACAFQQNQAEFCPETIEVNLSNNDLEFVNIQNGINTEIIDFNTTNNPNLECIQVDDVNTIGVNWLKDSTTSYNEDCNFGETYVPDDNFEQALIDLGYDSAPLNDYVPTINIEGILSLDVSGNAISDFTGIEDFLALENLNFSNNNLTSLQLTDNVNLLSLDCSSNQLMTLDVSNNINLEVLNCSINSLGNLDLLANSNLLDLDISANNFSTFSPSDIPSIQLFNCADNNLIDLDFQFNAAITDLNCQSNQLETLNLKNGQNTSLMNLDATNNPNLFCIETDTGAVPAGVNWLADPTAQFAEECFFGQTYVPDDNFEEALIDLGYDSGPLDDYVFTENIEDVTFLNIGGREISDLTGIEDFIGLTSLNFENNGVTIIDLSNNTLLVNLNASENLLTEIDISNQPNLVTLNVSGNSLSQVNLDNNLALVNLNVSNNQFSVLNISLLSNLEELKCASNDISSLDLTQNPNLSVLLCQSNALIADQLNIQNGNNENLQLFNATNNQDLSCILVDDPLAVIENTDGLYDNWLKDDSASYQTICEDADNDGVANADDLCPNTPFGATVDLFGCAVLDLPNDNFTVSITGETCLNSNNGKIRIEAQEIYNYTATLTSDIIIEATGESFYQEYNFTNDVDIFNLLASTYEMCITIEEWADYEICYTIVITEPDPLEVFASRNAAGNEVSLDMMGSLSYNIEFNGDVFTTHNPNLSLQLQEGWNQLKITTDLECQGVFEKQFYYSNEFLLYPNPFQEFIKIYNGKQDETVEVRLFNTYGQLIRSRSFENSADEILMDTSNLDEGVYLVTITSQTATSTHKIVKK